MISPTGIWSDEEVNTGHAFSYYTARWIGKFFNKKEVVFDFGCGKGTYLGYLYDLGFRNLYGIEGSKIPDRDYGGMVYNLDLSDDIFLQSVHIKNMFYYHSELNSDKINVISIEVFEHIPKQYEDQFISNIVNVCNNKLVISVAVEGQPGMGHVNCRNNTYVIDVFEKRGFKFMLEETASIRKKIEPHVQYLKNTLMVFEKK